MVGDIVVSGRGDIRGGIKAKVNHWLLAGIQVQVQSGIANDADDVLVADTEIVWHEE